MPADLTRIPEILRAAGLRVVVIEGFEGRGRPGSFAPGRMLIHHTAGKGDGLADARAMAENGRPDLKPPLAQTALDRSGTWYVLAAGRSNHAGRCKPIDGLKTYGPGYAYGDGNAQMAGVEVQNDGTEPFPKAQYDSLVRGTAAITKAFGWAPPLGHKETSVEGKPDPHGIDMNQFRREVAASNPQENDMTLDELLKADVFDNPMTTKATNPTLTFLGKENLAFTWAYRGELRGQRMEAQLAALSAAVEALATAIGADPKEIAEVVATEVRNRLSQITIQDSAALKA